MKSLSLSKPHLIVMVGISGAGKSFFAEQFSETFQAPLVSSSAIMTAIGKSSIPLKIINALIDQQMKELFKSRQSFIVDGHSDTKAERIALAATARKHGYEVLVIWVQTEPATAQKRSLKAAKTEQHRRVTTAEQHAAAVRRFTAPHTTERPIVISGKHTYATQAKMVLRKLAEPRADISVHTTTPTRGRTPGKHSIMIR
jgi:predicted kinase